MHNSNAKGSLPYVYIKGCPTGSVVLLSLSRHWFDTQWYCSHWFDLGSIPNGIALTESTLVRYPMVLLSLSRPWFDTQRQHVR